MIGRRTKAVNDTDAKVIYNIEVPDIMFLEMPEDTEEKTKLIEQYNSEGQQYFFLQDNYMDYFSASSTPKSCYDEIRSLVYQYLTYNASITITCQPKYYLEPNTLIYVQDKKSNIAGDFVIT